MLATKLRPVRAYRSQLDKFRYEPSRGQTDFVARSQPAAAMPRCQLSLD
jgi:hypothetical protein